ncbi:unnamed protein product [Caenorhabditis bovis]|uniref:DNA primase n=1 Tax=Caenorhabditis bovis TaxID=2654633 RepID=A0A8S1ETR4_9PELO|nr:unnamed protein product [Caenorhabditis bovis]
MSYNTLRFDSDLVTYYRNLFPFKPYVKWLQYGQKPSEYFCRREFAFILADDVHLRYKSFNDVLSFQKDLIATHPHKLDVGAVYNHMPKDHRKHTDFQAVERELVFDIDLTDYDTIRTCCKDAKVCPKCWKFVVQAVKILDCLLEQQFGFKARLWVFSGRRGVHCWIGDKKARQLHSTARSAIATRLNLFKKHNKVEVTEGKKKLTVNPPHVTQAYKAAMKGTTFSEMVIEQGWLNDAEVVFEYQYMTSAGKMALQEYLRSVDTPECRWKLLLRLYDDDTRKELQENGDNVPPPAFGRDKNVLKYFVLQRCYPRLDVNVSTGTNHLLKSPFCIHPKTGNVAVPLNVDDIENFDVENCPRIDHLVNELKDFEEGNEENMSENGGISRKVLAYKHTSLAPYVETFEKFVQLAIVS